MDDVVSRKCLSDALVQVTMQAALEHATSMGLPSSISVVDEAGTLKAFARMDGAPLFSVQLSQDKAFTAATTGLSTDQWFDRGRDGPLTSVVGVEAPTERRVAFGGGYPIFVEGDLVGAIGVSGDGHYTEDMEIAKSALAALAARVRV